MFAGKAKVQAESKEPAGRVRAGAGIKPVAAAGPAGAAGAEVGAAAILFTGGRGETAVPVTARGGKPEAGGGIKIGAGKTLTGTAAAAVRAKSAAEAAITGRSATPAKPGAETEITARAVTSGAGARSGAGMLAAVAALGTVLWQLFVAFGRANLFGFGGGPSVIPLIQQEVVDNYHWLSTEEYTDALAMGNALPGPIATKMAAYVGYKIAGYWGALSALLGTVMPTAVAMVALAGLYFKYKDAPQIQGMLRGVRPVVVVLLVQVAWEMGVKSFPVPSTWIIALVALVAVFALKVHPLALILASMTYGFFFLSGRAG